MFFYIDESGNTGRNLFDANQPNLYYGVLSSKLNIDLLCKKNFIKAKEELGIKKLHGKDLSQTKIINILPFLLELQKKYKFRFDFFRVVKPDHALISFFDQVFDQGNNPAYSWIGYWTPMRYVMLIKLASLFDEDTLKKAWAARIELDSQRAEKIVIEICETIQSRIGALVIPPFLTDIKNRGLSSY